MAQTRKHILKLTDLELIALIEILDDVSGMIGTGDDLLRVKNLKKVDKALAKNGFKREFN